MRKFLSVILALFVMVSISKAEWEIETRDAPTSFYEMHERTLAVDKNGISHAVFGMQHLYHAWFDGTQWHNEMVDGAANVGRYASLSIDHSGALHVSYYDGTNGDLKYASNKSGAWVLESVDTEGSVGTYSAIALDASDQPAILYRDASNVTYKLARHLNGAWAVESLGIPFNASTYTPDASIGIDSAANVHIAYQYGNKLMYATNASGSWQRIAADDAAYVYGTSLLIDASDKIHIAYTHGGWSDHTLAHATNASGTWTHEIVDPETGAGKHPSMAMDASGKLHISHYGSNAKYSTNVSGVWENTLLSNDPYSGSFTSLALDALGSVRVTYLNKDTIEHVSNLSGEWVHTAVYDRHLMGSQLAMLVDGNGAEHIVYNHRAYMGESKLIHLTNGSGEWVSETIDTFAASGAFNDAVLDAEGFLHISYANAYRGNLMYATDRSGTWSIATLQSNVFPNHSGGIALDSAGFAHLSYNSGFRVYHATNKEGSWRYEAIDPDTVSMGYSSILTDALGHVHISYHDYTNYTPKYATNAQGTWTIQTLDSSMENSYGSSIASDAAGNIYVTYAYYNYVESNDTYIDGLNLATLTEGVWQVENLYSHDIGTIDRTHLRFDDHGFAHLTFADYDRVMYASNAAGSWQFEQLDHGKSNALSITKEGALHVAFVNAAGDLAYAYRAPEPATVSGLNYPGNSANGLICKKGENGALILYDENGDKTVIPAKNRTKASNQKAGGKPQQLFYNPETGECESR